MNTLYGLIHRKRYRNTSKADRKNNQSEALAVFNALTLQEKCLYLIKINKRNTSYQALVLMGLALMIIATNYYLL
ncbi:hypothetical protein [Clostridium formicaceticum]|uniref:Uncharacterized protein n=1 Tax=Clostridium formicaceticum TaxID=1497 RepID=A0AAC9RN54_9CLOT|nr:hypothetical protein [Clostridium formicaceticum]AOY78087.1 hypothetical protein BJL90_20815 [Clostridium formicaceticum]ARE88734.1 hypothetical protein CLFO_31400 [Clostridium formicaceticum]